MEMFRSVLMEECQLCDLGFKVQRVTKFTWSNRRRDQNFTKERLDRVMANKEWCEKFKDAEVFVLPARSSDHKPLLLSVHNRCRLYGPKRRSFKFEASWTLDEECNDVIKATWERRTNENNILQIVSYKLQRCQHTFISVE